MSRRGDTPQLTDRELRMLRHVQRGQPVTAEGLPWQLLDTLPALERASLIGHYPSMAHTVKEMARGRVAVGVAQVYELTPAGVRVLNENRGRQV